MELLYRIGCTCDAMTIDGIETIDIPINDFKNTLKILIDKETDIGILQNIFKTILECNGTEKSSAEPCECCGDYICEYKMKI